MEGMWTRFFPAVVKAQEIVKSGAIGKVVAVHADFGFNGADVADYPDHMFYKLNLGGGGLFYVAPYPVAAAIQFLGPEPPARIAAAGVKDKLTGVDLSGAISLHFEGKGIASLTYNIEVRLHSLDVQVAVCTRRTWCGLILVLWFCVVETALPTYFLQNHLGSSASFYFGPLLASFFTCFESVVLKQPRMS